MGSRGLRLSNRYPKWVIGSKGCGIQHTILQGWVKLFNFTLPRSTDNEAQGQSAKLVDANGVILCLNWHERLRDFHYLPKDEKTLVEILM